MAKIYHELATTNQFPITNESGMLEGDVLVFELRGRYHFYKVEDGLLTWKMMSGSFEGDVGSPGSQGPPGQRGVTTPNVSSFAINTLHLGDTTPNNLSSLWIKPDGDVLTKVNGIWTKV